MEAFEEREGERAELLLEKRTERGKGGGGVLKEGIPFWESLKWKKESRRKNREEFDQHPKALANRYRQEQIRMDLKRTVKGLKLCAG